MPQPSDIPFHAEFSSADASALSEVNSRFTMYQQGSKTVTLTVGAGDQVFVTDLLVRVGGTGLTVQVYDGTDNVVDAGEKVFIATLPASGGVDWAPSITHQCIPSTYPKVKTSAAGQIDVVARGFIRPAAT